MSPQFHWTSESLATELQQNSLWGAVSASGVLQAFAVLANRAGNYEFTVLATRKGFHGQGIMKNLLQTLLELTRGSEVWLEVHEANSAALSLYQAIGFQKTGLRKQYYRDRGSAILLSFKPTKASH